MKRFFTLLAALVCSTTVAFCAEHGALHYGDDIVCGAERTEEYIPLLEGRRVGILTNRSGMCKGVHLVDTLLSRGIDIRYIFAPEHGFRGDVSAGEQVADGLAQQIEGKYICIPCQMRK